MTGYTRAGTATPHATTVRTIRLLHAKVTCRCGWSGPLRGLGDPHHRLLVADDAQWHMHECGVVCGVDGCVRCWGDVA